MGLSLLKKPKKITSETFSAMSKPENLVSYEIRSGFMVIASLTALITLLFFAGKSQLFQNTREVKISFNYIGGLSENAPVLFAGHKAGRVTRIEFTPNEKNLIQVTAQIKRSVPVHPDSEAYIDTLGFMGEKYLALTAGTSGSALLEEKQTLAGTDPIPVMEIIKKGAEITEQFEKTSKSLDELLKEMHGMVGENKDEISSILKNLNETSLNLKDMTADVKAHPWKLLRKDSPKKKKRFLVV